MRVVFALTHVNFWLQMEPAGRELARQGHEVTVLLDREMNKKFAERFELPAPGEGEDAIPVDWLKRRKDRWWAWTDFWRELINFLSYYHARRAPFSETLARRWVVYLPKWLQWLPERPGISRFLASDPMKGLMGWLAERAPLYEKIVKDLKKRKPDVLVAAATFLPHSLELEYLRTARRLGIRTVVVIPSWDNLTTKGILHEMADRVLVWNAAQIEEAVTMLQVPRERLAMTGAPRYDLWFNLRPRLSANEFRAEAGLGEGPVIVWLCSSGFIAKDEVAIVREVAAHLARDPRWQALGGQLLVRPHFQNLPQWRAAGDPAKEGFSLWPHPDKLERFQTEDLHQGLFDTLYHSAGAVGINTSAFLEASVVDRPCLALLDPRVAGTQSDIPHFQHLIRGGFLQTAPDPAGLAELLSRVLAGEDPLRENRRKFVEAFLRPHGLAESACGRLAGEVAITPCQ
jgi:hypothetical protein